MPKYTKNYTVVLDDMDMQQYRLRPISAISYIQDTFARYSATRKMAAFDLQTKGQYWVISELNMQIMDTLPFWGEEIKVELWFSEISKLKIYADFRLYYNNKVFAQGDSLWLIMDIKNRRVAKADEMAAKFAVCKDLALGVHSKVSLPDTAGEISSFSHNINISDIDFNNHTNNKSYLHIAAMALPEDFRKTHLLKTIQVRFNKETFLGDNLICRVYKTEQENRFLHRLDKDGVPVCDVITSWKNVESYTTIVDYDLKVKSEYPL